MPFFRFATVVALFLGLTDVVSAQMTNLPQFQPIQIPVPQQNFDLSKFQTIQNQAIQKQMNEVAESTFKRAMIFVIPACVMAVIIIGASVMKWLLKPRVAKDRMELAMADPWMRAQLEGMTPQERADVLGIRRDNGAYPQ